MIIIIIIIIIMYKTFNKGNNTTCAINCNNRIPATIYTVEKWFV